MTFRELVWMHGGAVEERWSRWSELLAMLAEIHRDHKIRPSPYTARDFNPYAPARSVETIKVKPSEVAKMLSRADRRARARQDVKKSR